MKIINLSKEQQASDGFVFSKEIILIRDFLNSMYFQTRKESVFFRERKTLSYPFGLFILYHLQSGKPFAENG